MISFILNIPYSIIGIVLACASIPVRLEFNVNPPAIIFKVKKFWWTAAYLKGARAMTIGNVILLGSNIEERDLEHELIHVRQYQREPLIHPFLYYLELRRKGYRNNKYEIEAYQRAGNIYKN